MRPLPTWEIGSRLAGEGGLAGSANFVVSSPSGWVCSARKKDRPSAGRREAIIVPGIKTS
jgi:hypothetical protein